jgi:hypothetical protein
MKTAGAVLVAGALLFAAPALAQYYPTQPPPGPPPPPPGYYPPPPPRYYPPQPYWDGKTHFTIRASGGVSFIGAGYYCGYYNTYPGFVNYGCGAGYSSVEPDVNLDFDIWFRPSFGLTLGANVMWGSYTSGGSFASVGTISSTTWEPHVDFLFAPSYVANDQWKGRLRLGFGLYVADANNGNTGTGPTNYNNVGGAFRVGLGASILPKSVVGIGIDAIFEGGWIGGNYVSTVQLLIGPELHF